MSDPITILMAGGGSGGHLYPGIAVADAIRSLRPEVNPVFLCTERAIDQTILQPTGYEFIRQPIVPPQRSIGGLLKFWKRWRQTLELVEETFADRKPAAVLGLGGYAAGVAVKLAGKRELPAGIINPDVIPGKANQYLMRYIRSAFCQFEETSRHVHHSEKPKLVVTGCPIRADITVRRAQAEARRALGLDPLLNTLLVTGASQGAVTVNEAIIETLRGMKLNGWQVLHLSGPEHSDSVRAGYREIDQQAVVIDFTANMADVWAATDLAVSRAGASSCAELTATGVPSILLPYPFHKDMHQLANAKVLEAAGAAVIVGDLKDARRTTEGLRPALEGLLYEPARRERMRAAAIKISRPDAARIIAEQILGWL